MSELTDPSPETAAGKREKQIAAEITIRIVEECPPLLRSEINEESVQLLMEMARLNPGTWDVYEIPGDRYFQIRYVEDWIHPRYEYRIS